MLLQWSSPEYMPHSFQISGLSGTIGYKQTGNCFDLTKQVADGLVNMQELSKGLFWCSPRWLSKKKRNCVKNIQSARCFSFPFA